MVPMADSMALEECANCARAIGRLETPCIYKEQVVCAECYARLCPALDCAPTAPADLEHKQPNPISTAGQRIDKLIARGMQFGDAASKKVKDMADAAAPKLKAAAQTVTVNAKGLGDKAAPTLKRASAVVAEKSSRSLIGKSRDFLNAGSILRKAILIYLCAMGGLVVLSVIAMPFILLMSGGFSSSHRGGSFSVDDYDKIIIGMSENNIDGILGKETLLSPETATNWRFKRWGDIDADSSILEVQFRSGKAYRKTLASGDEFRAKRAIEALGNQYGRDDQTIWVKVEESYGNNFPWDVPDAEILEASVEMRQAYQTWRSACVAFPERVDTLYSTGFRLGLKEMNGKK
jgi:hypothetical protein